MSVIEAILLWTDIIMTRYACVSEVLKEDAIYVAHPYSIEEWEEKLQMVLKNDCLCKVKV